MNLSRVDAMHGQVQSYLSNVYWCTLAYIRTLKGKLRKQMKIDLRLSVGFKKKISLNTFRVLSQTM